MATVERLMYNSYAVCFKQKLRHKREILIPKPDRKLRIADQTTAEELIAG